MSKEKPIRRNNGGGYKHGLPRDSLYNVWVGMRNRCNNSNHDAYSQYGGRGITYSSDWDNYGNFHQDMKDGYKKGLSLEREDNDGLYCKENCRWATPAEQQRNKSNNRWFEKDGVRMIGMDWAKFFGVKYSSLFFRLKKGTFDEAYDFYEKKKLKKPIPQTENKE